MGCGSSTEVNAETQIDLKLSSHISFVLGIAPESTDVKGYVAVLRLEGWDTPDDFDGLAVDELKAEPFSWKPGHLKKVARSRSREKETNEAELQRTHTANNTRGQCKFCSLDVYDTQPRFKDPKTGAYQHQHCLDASDSGSATLLGATARTSTNVLLSSELTITDAKTKAAAAAEVAEAEAAAIMAAADVARDAVIAEAKRRAGASLADAEEDAAQIAAAAQSRQSNVAAAVRNINHETASASSDSAQQSQLSSMQPATQPFSPSGPKTKLLLPGGKHAFLSYQWDVQEQVKEIKTLLFARGIRCWMDVDGGMKSDIYDSMAEGVQGAACVVCFMTEAYQNSANCKLELKFAQQSGVPIIPVMMQVNFAAKGWLGILTSGSIWTPMHDSQHVLDGIDKLIVQAQHLVPGMRGGGDAGTDTASEVSDSTLLFDVGAWGDEMFSLDEMREELERLREVTAPSERNNKKSSGSKALVCTLPAMVPTLPRGLFVTSEMESVLEAVLSDSSMSQIGFCGMGGIGKTTVSCWVTRSDTVRTKFGMVAWITLGQTPTLDSCINLLHLQLTGSAVPDGISIEQKHELLKQAFLTQSVLLILDDCWDADVAKHFIWIDHATNSKVLMSSRVRNVLDGGEIIDVTVPSNTDASKMLLSTAGMDVDALQSRTEVTQVVELCKRLPLTIGVAGKLIRQLGQGSDMSEASDWTDVVTLLEDEMNDPDGSLSVEESVIRASIKSIPKNFREQATQLFYGFSLVPEDTHVPLPVLGMIYHACTTNEHGKTSTTKPLSRMQVRRYLKVLIDRSLVLGTVDRPQLHDVMLDYVQKELAGDANKAAQRRLVEAFKTMDRSPAVMRTSAVGKYMKLLINHHITASYDDVWGTGVQAISWLEDHVNGVQDEIAIAAASVLSNVETLANDAEDAKMWWRAALRWSALARLKMIEAGNMGAGQTLLERAVKATKNITKPINTGGNSIRETCTQFELDTFELNALVSILMSWDAKILDIYKDRVRKLATTDAGKNDPSRLIKIFMVLDWGGACISGNPEAYAAACWKLTVLQANVHDEGGTTTYLAKPMVATWLFGAGDGLFRVPGFTLDYFGTNGDFLFECANTYSYEDHHLYSVNICSLDTNMFSGGDHWWLALQYGRVTDAVSVLKDRVCVLEKCVADITSPSRSQDILFGMSTLLVACHVYGQSQLVQKIIDILDITFDSASEFISKHAEPSHNFTAMEHKGPSGGKHLSSKRLLWQVQSFIVMHTNVPLDTAKAWLESMPDNETVYQYALCAFATHDNGAMLGTVYQMCWVALVHEKVGLYDGALRFCGLALETDLRKAGAPFTKAGDDDSVHPRPRA